MPVHLPRTATLAWSPRESADPTTQYLVSGTVSGALDASFSATADLELFRISRGGLLHTKPAASLSLDSRFNRLAWGSSGILAGGLADGSVRLWSPGNLEPSSSSPAHLNEIINSKRHTGSVAGLEFNSLQPHLLGSGGGDGEVGGPCEERKNRQIERVEQWPLRPISESPLLIPLFLSQSTYRSSSGT